MAFCIKFLIFVSVLLFINSFLLFFAAGYCFKSAKFDIFLILIPMGFVFFSGGLNVYLNSILVYDKSKTINHVKSSKRVRFSSSLEIYTIDEGINQNSTDDSNQNLDNQTTTNEHCHSFEKEFNETLSQGDTAYIMNFGTQETEISEISNIVATERLEYNNGLLLNKDDSFFQGNLCLPTVKCSEDEEIDKSKRLFSSNVTRKYKSKKIPTAFTFEDFKNVNNNDMEETTL